MTRPYQPGQMPSQQQPSFVANINRNKTRKWTEARQNNYDGDDWGDSDDIYDDYAQSAPDAQPQPSATHPPDFRSQPSRGPPPPSHGTPSHGTPSSRDFSQPTQVPPALGTSSDQSAHPPPTSSFNRQQPVVASPEMDKPLPPAHIVRPADIYKRMAAEKEKERLSSHSSQPADSKPLPVNPTARDLPISSSDDHSAHSSTPSQSEILSTGLGLSEKPEVEQDTPKASKALPPSPTKTAPPPSPTPGRVRHLADKFNDYSSRDTSPVSPSKASFSSWNESETSSRHSQPNEKTSNSPTRPQQRDDTSTHTDLEAPPSFRPSIPGQWVSYTTSPQPNAASTQSTPQIPQKDSTPTKDTASSLPLLDTDSTPKARDMPVSDSLSSPLAHLTAAGSALGAALAATTEPLMQTFTSTSSTDGSGPATRTSPPPVVGDVLLRPLALDRAATSVASSVPPSPLPKDTPSVEPLQKAATHKTSGYFNTTPQVVPAEELSRPSTAASAASDGEDSESDRLRRDIVRSLDPIRDTSQQTALTSLDAVATQPRAAQEPEHRTFALTDDTDTPAPSTSRSASGAAPPARPAMLDQRFSWEEPTATPDELPDELPTRNISASPSAMHHVDETEEKPVSPEGDTPVDKDRPQSPVSPVVPAQSQSHVADDDIEDLHGPSADTPPLVDAHSPPLDVSKPLPTVTGFRSQRDASRSVSAQTKIPTFRELLAITSTEDRILAFKSAQTSTAHTDSGLQDWIGAMISSRPEHASLATAVPQRPMDTSELPGRRIAAPSLNRIANALGSSTSSNTDGLGRSASHKDSESMHSTQHASLLKSKELLGKSVVGAKGWLAKGKQKLREGGSAKDLTRSLSSRPSSFTKNARHSSLQTQHATTGSMAVDEATERQVVPERSVGEVDTGVTSNPYRHGHSSKCPADAIAEPDLGVPVDSASAPNAMTASARPASTVAPISSSPTQKDAVTCSAPGPSNTSARPASDRAIPTRRPVMGDRSRLPSQQYVSTAKTRPRSTSRPQVDAIPIESAMAVQVPPGKDEDMITSTTDREVPNVNKSALAALEGPSYPSGTTLQQSQSSADLVRMLDDRSMPSATADTAMLSASHQDPSHAYGQHDHKQVGLRTSQAFDAKTMSVLAVEHPSSNDAPLTLDDDANTSHRTSGPTIPDQSAAEQRYSKTESNLTLPNTVPGLSATVGHTRPVSSHSRTSVLYKRFSGHFRPRSALSENEPEPRPSASVAIRPTISASQAIHSQETDEPRRSGIWRALSRSGSQATVKSKAEDPRPGVSTQLPDADIERLIMQSANHAQPVRASRTSVTRHDDQDEAHNKPHSKVQDEFSDERYSISQDKPSDKRNSTLQERPKHRSKRFSGLGFLLGRSHSPPDTHEGHIPTVKRQRSKKLTKARPASRSSLKSANSIEQAGPEATETVGMSTRPRPEAHLPVVGVPEHGSLANDRDSPQTSSHGSAPRSRPGSQYGIPPLPADAVKRASWHAAQFESRDALPWEFSLTDSQRHSQSAAGRQSGHDARMTWSNSPSPSPGLTAEKASDRSRHKLSKRIPQFSRHGTATPAPQGDTETSAAREEQIMDSADAEPVYQAITPFEKRKMWPVPQSPVEPQEEMHNASEQRAQTTEVPEGDAIAAANRAWEYSAPAMPLSTLGNPRSRSASATSISDIEVSASGARGFEHLSARANQGTRQVEFYAPNPLFRDESDGSSAPAHKQSMYATSERLVSSSRQNQGTSQEPHDSNPTFAVSEPEQTIKPVPESQHIFKKEAERASKTVVPTRTSPAVFYTTTTTTTVTTTF